jgi:hypothetical protein
MLPIAQELADIIYLVDNRFIGVQFKFLTAMVIKSPIFSDVMPFSPLKANCHFGETWFLEWFSLQP